MRGATVNQEISIDITKINNYTDEIFKLQASISFLSFLKINGSVHRDKTEIDTYNSAKTNLKFSFKGGRLWNTNWTYNDWIDTVKEDPVNIKIYVMSILDLITPYRFNNVTAKNLQGVLAVINAAINIHIEQNTHHGCMNPASSRYSYRANIHDESACLYNMKYTYGGAYQVSSLSSRIVKNIITQDTKCPVGFNAHALVPSLRLSYNAEEDNGQCVKKCTDVKLYDLNYSDLRLYCISLCIEYTPKTIYYTVQPFVCLANNLNEQGVYFGGAYTSMIANVVTGTNKCPNGYKRILLIFGIILCELPSINSSHINFGGIITTSLTNPYTNAYYLSCRV